MRGFFNKIDFQLQSAGQNFSVFQGEEDLEEATSVRGLRTKSQDFFQADLSRDGELLTEICSAS